MPGDACGVLVIAHGDAKFARQARALAWSVRHHMPGLPLAVASDLDPRLFDRAFDRVIAWDFSHRPGTSAKLEAYDITPFESTLLIDSDCLCVRPLAPVFAYFAGQDVGVYGDNTPDFVYGDRSDGYRALVDAESYPSYNGGLYYIRRSPVAAAVFARVKQLAANFDALDLRRPRARYNDEVTIGLAMAAAGLRATDRGDRVVMIAPHHAARTIDIDALAGRCRFHRDGRAVEPDIVHFVGTRDRMWVYRRERWALELIAGRGWPRAIRPALGLAARLWGLGARVAARISGAV